MNVNRVEFSGNLAADAAQRQAGDNTVTSFRMGVNPRKRGGKEQGETMWFNCSVWGNRGNSLLPYLKKGQRVLVFGALTQRTYEKDGQTRLSYDINVDSIDFVNTTRNSEGNASADAPVVNVDDLPF
jgi:single-strand DNA-binding protein